MDTLSIENLQRRAHGFDASGIIASTLLPERVLQFGTGALLRGQPDYFIDKANKQGLFNGRVVVVKTTDKGGNAEFEAQNGLYAQRIRGVQQGSTVDTVVINAAISRVLLAGSEWQQILALADNPLMDIVISNTTEVGISWHEESIFAEPPASFPGKLLAYLWRRYQTFEGAPEMGLVIIPTELISNNASVLRDLCNRLAVHNGLDANFLHWLNHSNYFCNSLVDRIVPGKLSAAEQQLLDESLGLHDQLAIMSEPYALWAIETNSEVGRQRLTFAGPNPEMVLTESIAKFRKLKLHLLNGTHTFCCGLAILCGFKTVSEALEKPDFLEFTVQLLHQEIIPCMVDDDVTLAEAQGFASQVLDRFKNPFIAHYWESISLNYSTKMRLRNVVLLERYATLNAGAPPRMALAFAAMLLYLHGRHGSVPAQAQLFPNKFGEFYPLQDGNVSILNGLWANDDIDLSVPPLLAEAQIWGTDLNVLPSFTQAVKDAMHQLMFQEPITVLADCVTQKTMDAA